jgi:malate synthase
MTEKILTKEAKTFLNLLSDNFASKINFLLNERKTKHAVTSFIESTKDIREMEWTIDPVSEEIQDRRVEITGPPVRKMIINALNSGAKVYMADFEDSNSPTWENCIQGQINLRDAVNREIDFVDQKSGKEYKLNNSPAVLFVRPRGLHLIEKNYVVHNNPIPACLFDFGLYVFHNHKKLIENNSAPYFYLPKLEHHLEARMWNEIFTFTEKYLNLKHGTIKATVLIETLPAAFQMHEILFELREHSAGLNCGRWDYIFSFIKTMKNNKRFTLPDRDIVGMSEHFMRSYSQLLIQTCHTRGAHAMGGMAAQIPIKNDTEANNFAMSKVKNDKLREVTDGHDGTWVAHPALVKVATDIFDKHMPEPNQINKKLILNNSIDRMDLITIPKGQCTEEGLRKNIKICFQYLNAWINGNGCVPINNLMEDAATAEISRAQIWQWLNNGICLTNEKIVNNDLVKTLINEELEPFKESNNFNKTKQVFENLCFSEELVDFLTTECYDYLP